MWRRALASLSGERHVLLEFVADDSPDALLKDAATLRAWAGAEPAAGIPSPACR